MDLAVINTGFFKLDGGAMFGVVPKTMWQKANPPDSNNLCTWAMRCLLVVEGSRILLIDNGIGNKQSEKFFSHYYLHGTDSLISSLKSYGVSPQEVTDVFLTHLHFDHCGGGVERVGDTLRTVFTNASYWSNSDHWKWATQPNAREKASFLPENILPMQQSGQLKMITRADQIENMQVMFVHGHTDKMMIPKITYKGRTLCFMADLIPSVGHIPLPYVMGYDTRPLLTLQEKEIFLQEAARLQYVLFLEHDPVHECCTVKQTERGIRLDETFRLRDL